MKLEVWTEPESKEEEPTRVRWRKLGGNRLLVEIVDADGHGRNRGRVGFLDESGFERIPGLDPAFGFALDDRGRIADV